LTAQIEGASTTRGTISSVHTNKVIISKENKQHREMNTKE